jgi:hypothetical protein
MPREESVMFVRRPCWALIVLYLLFPSICARAQFATATVSGSVRTTDDRPIPGARVHWSQIGQSVSLVTDSDGKFYFHFATPGHHNLTFEHSSTPAIGRYEAQLNPGFLLHLTVVLHSAPGNSSAPDAWEITRQEIPAREVWPPEYVLTENQIESLPGTGHLWTVLSHAEAAAIVERYDISGLHSHRQFLLGVRGSSWSQNQATLDGVTITNPSGDGMLLFPDLDEVEAVVFSVGDSPTRHTGAGAHLVLIPKSGEQSVHGQAQLFFQCGALQNTNPTDRLRFFGITESDERWRHYVNGGFQLGGPLGRRSWNYFTSFSMRDFEKRIRNQAVPVSANLSQASLRLSGRWSSNDLLSFYGSAQRLLDRQADASPQITRDSSLDQRQTLYAAQGGWTRYISPKSLLDVRFGVSHKGVTSRFQPGIQGQSREDIFPGYALAGLPDSPSPWVMLDMLNNTRTGPAPLAVSGDSGSAEGSAAYSTVRAGFGHSNHRLSVGGSFRRMFLDQRYAAQEDINLLFFEGVPTSVRLLNTPAQTRDRVGQLEWYASDSVSLARLTMTLGVSVDSSRGNNLLTRGQSAGMLRWTNVGGRLGVSYQVLDRGSVVVRAGVAQIYSQPLASTWTAINPEGVGARLYSWNDANGDMKFQPGENSQILKVSGSPYARMQPDLKNPRTTEIALGCAIGGSRGISYQFFGFHRMEHRLISLVNEGVPFSSYVPVQVMDPGNDGTVGTPDDGLITVFNQKAETLGQDRYLLTNPQGFGAYSQGMEMKLGFSYGRFQGQVTMARYRAVASTAPGIGPRENDTSALLGVFDDPNKAILARGSTYFDRGTLGRVWMTSRLPWKLRGSAILSYQDGLPFSRYLPVKGLNQGVIGVLTVQRGPGTRGSKGGPRTVYASTADVRICRDFLLKHGTLAASLDAFNLMNHAHALVETDVTAPTQYWRIPLRFETPRSLQLGLQFRW